MSWFTTSDYFIMDAIARARAEELRQTNEQLASAQDDRDRNHDAPARSAELPRPAPAPCRLSRKAA